MAKESLGENLETHLKGFIEYCRGLTNISVFLNWRSNQQLKVFVKRLLNSLWVNWTDSALSKGAEKPFGKAYEAQRLLSRLRVK